MSLEAAKIPPGARLPTRLVAHATDTDDAATPPTAVRGSDCLGTRAAKNRQQLKLGKGA